MEKSALGRSRAQESAEFAFGKRCPSLFPVSVLSRRLSRHSFGFPPSPPLPWPGELILPFSHSAPLPLAWGGPPPRFLSSFHFPFPHCVDFTHLAMGRVFFPLNFQKINCAFFSMKGDFSPSKGEQTCLPQSSLTKGLLLIFSCSSTVPCEATLPQGLSLCRPRFRLRS